MAASIRGFLLLDVGGQRRRRRRREGLASTRCPAPDAAAVPCVRASGSSSSSECDAAAADSGGEGAACGAPPPAKRARGESSIAARFGEAWGLPVDEAAALRVPSRQLLSTTSRTAPRSTCASGRARARRGWPSGTTRGTTSGWATSRRCRAGSSSSATRRPAAATRPTRRSPATRRCGRPRRATPTCAGGGRRASARGSRGGARPWRRRRRRWSVATAVDAAVVAEAERLQAEYRASGRYIGSFFESDLAQFVCCEVLCGSARVRACTTHRAFAGPWS